MKMGNAALLVTFLLILQSPRVYGRQWCPVWPFRCPPTISEQERTDLCDAYCNEFAVACPNVDITSLAISSEKATGSPVSHKECVAKCMDSKMKFDGTPQDFDNVDSIQCRMNHARMQIQQKDLASSDHCLHAMIRGRSRCDPKNPEARAMTVLFDIGRSVFYDPLGSTLTAVNRLASYAVGAIYLSAFRERLLVSYPYVEIPDEDVTCSDPEDTRFRTADGSCNNVAMPKMGATGTQFIQLFQPSTRQGLPSPEAVAEIIKRPESSVRPERLAPFSQLAVAWIQMMTHDWFAHSPNDPGKNQVSHWWDASQLYGSKEDQATPLRLDDGKLHLDINQEVDYEDGSNIPRTGFTDNWWAGLHAMHTLFIREHNYIVDQLEAQYKGMYDEEEKYQLARLSVSALIAKIHTVEWTPTLLDNDVSTIALETAWWGIESAIKKYGSEFLFDLGFPLLGDFATPHAGSHSTEETLYNTTFQMTEEFVAVYRMHPLLPDHIKVPDPATGGTKKFTLNELAFADARQLVEEKTTQSFLEGFGKTPARAITLQNYPRQLYGLEKPGMPRINLAAIDIQRDRERGLPLYNDMRRLLLLEPYESIDDLTSDANDRKLLRSVYNDIEEVDLMVGSMVDQQLPSGFGFGIVPFRIFQAFATRRIYSDRFFMQDFKKEVYTEWGFNHVQTETFSSVIARHYPELKSKMPENPFMNWA